MSYEAKCYYDGKLLGRCTRADADGFMVLSQSCHGDMERVLKEYTYFSKELKAILEKAASIQRKSKASPAFEKCRIVKKA